MIWILRLPTSFPLLRLIENKLLGSSLTGTITNHYNERVPSTPFYFTEDIKFTELSKSVKYSENSLNYIRMDLKTSVGVQRKMGMTR